MLLLDGQQNDFNITSSFENSPNKNSSLPAAITTSSNPVSNTVSTVFVNQVPHNISLSKH